MKYVQAILGGVLGMSGGLLVLGVFFASPAVSETVGAAVPDKGGEPIVRVVLSQSGEAG